MSFVKTHHTPFVSSHLIKRLPSRVKESLTDIRKVGSVNLYKGALGKQGVLPGSVRT
jgi:hypothetical protein